MAFPSDLVRTKNWGTEVLTDSDLEGQFDLIINWVMASLDASTGHDHDGTSNQGPKIPLGSLTVASQAQGDVIYASSASAWARLGAGTSGQFLKTQGAAANPTWATAAFQTAASQANMEAATDNTVPVTPLSTKWHPGVPKCIIVFDGTAASPITPGFAYGISGTTIVKNGTGDYTVTFATAFSAATAYGLIGSGSDTGAGSNISTVVGFRSSADRTTTTARFITWRTDTGAVTDFPVVSVAFYGDL